MSESSNALAVIERLPDNHPIKSHLAYGSVFVASGMWPDCRTASQAIVKIQAGSELGLGPFFSMRHIRIIKGNVELSSHALACLIKQSQKYTYRVTEKTAKLCTIEFYERDHNGTPELIGTETFTIEMAARAGLAGGTNWKSWPEAMLFARAISAGMRTHTPDVGQGVYHFGEVGGEEEVFDTPKSTAVIEHVSSAEEHVSSADVLDEGDAFPDSPEVVHKSSTMQEVLDDGQDAEALDQGDLESMLPDVVPPVLRKAVLDLTIALRDSGQKGATPNDAWKLVSEAATAKRERLTAPFIRSFIPTTV